MNTSPFGHRPFTIWHLLISVYTMAPHCFIVQFQAENGVEIFTPFQPWMAPVWSFRTQELASEFKSLQYKLHSTGPGRLIFGLTSGVFSGQGFRRSLL